MEAKYQAKIDIEIKQAYLGLVFKNIASYVILGCLVYSVIDGSFGVGLAIAFAIIYAFLQSETTTLNKIAERTPLLKERSSDKENKDKN